MGHTLLPIFYDVNPSDVRKQTGTFAEAFARHEERFQAETEKVHKWRAALTESANFSGWDLQSVANGYESTFIEKIVEEIVCKLKQAHSHVPIHLVGIDSRVEEMKALLDLGTSDVRIVGIHGMGGIGKTTLAKVVYNEICHEFEGSSCLLNIKEISKQPNGLIRLQEQLLYDVLKTKNLNIDNVDQGINLIKERFRRKRVLIVLDDVDHLEQLNSFVGNSEWYGAGSRVILTTRDEHLPTELGVYGTYKVEELNHEQSLQLFSWHAFKMAHPVEDYLELVTGVVTYTGGLPLALEILGSYLLGRSIIEWKSALEKLQKIPYQRIQKILRISFDSLEDDTVKNIFLDIACFFIGEDNGYVSKVLNGCGFFSDIGINILIQRSLLKVDIENKLRMHDLIRDMGREIVRESSPSDPGKRSRLWFHEDVLKVLSKHMGSEAVEGLILNLPVHEDVILKTEAFSKMKNLRLLQIDGVHLIGCYEHLSKELRWLHWHKCSLQFLPSNFHLENLVTLDMQLSNLKQVWKGIKILNKLKVLNLSNSKYLTKLPNLLRVPFLEMMILEGCTSLVEVHESIGYLKKLVFLNLKGCKNLRNLPGSISNLKSLKTLNLSGCLKLDKLSEELGNMIALKELLVDRTAIKQLPSSFGLLKNLEMISISGCKGQASKSWLSRFLSRISPKSWNPLNLLPASVSGLHSLRVLNISGCNLSEDDIPIDFGSLSSLKELDLSRNNFRNLPNSISCLPRLLKFWVSECTSLQSISKLPANLELLDASGCTSLQRISNQSKLNFSSIYLYNCNNLVEIQGLEVLEETSFHMSKCYNLAYDFRKSLLQYLSKPGGYRDILLPGDEVPNWFDNQTTGCSISFDVPSLLMDEIKGLLVCAVYAPKKETAPLAAILCFKSHIESESRTENVMFFTRGIPKDHSFLSYIPISYHGGEMTSGMELKVYMTLGNDHFDDKKFGIHLVVDEPNVTDEHGSVIQCVNCDTSGHCTTDMVCAKRGREDNEAGPSNVWTNEEKCSKRLRMESEAQECKKYCRMNKWKS